MSATFSAARQAEFLRLLSLAAAHLLETDDPDLLVRGIFQIASPQLGIDTYFNYMVVEEAIGWNWPPAPAYPTTWRLQ